VPGTLGYAISKYAQIALSNVMNAEYSRFNITSNIIDIGFYEFGLYNELSSKDKDFLKSGVVTSPNTKNAAAAIRFLVESTDTLGACIPVNGARYVGKPRKN
jgi:NAD(P)-dependent dehydrogenase (short-subunit alcohol dehydrogenase family)